MNVRNMQFALLLTSKRTVEPIRKQLKKKKKMREKPMRTCPKWAKQFVPKRHKIFFFFFQQKYSAPFLDSTSGTYCCCYCAIFYSLYIVQWLSSSHSNYTFLKFQFISPNIVWPNGTSMSRVWANVFRFQTISIQRCEWIIRQNDIRTTLYLYDDSHPLIHTHTHTLIMVVPWCIKCEIPTPKHILKFQWK